MTALAAHTARISVPQPGPWMTDPQRRCAGTDPEVWFPEKGESNKAAMRLCKACPFRDPCREYATANSLLGIWGATTENDRKRERGRRVRGGAPWTS